MTYKQYKLMPIMFFCFNFRRTDRIEIDVMHRRGNLISLEQRKQKQLLCLMIIFKDSCTYTRGAKIGVLKCVQFCGRTL